MPQPIQKTTSRRWLTFRISTLLLAVGLVSIALGYPHLRHYVQFQRFKSFVGRDLSQLSDEETKLLRNIVKELLQTEDSPFTGTKPLLCIWKSECKTKERFLLLQTSGIYAIPGDNPVYLTTFNSSGQVIKNESFPTGYRNNLVDANIEHESPFGPTPILRIRTGPGIHGTPAREQYYAVVENEIVLLRLEDNNGSRIKNRQYSLGPEPTQRTETQWLSGLRDPNPIEVLRSLNWLADADSPVDSAETVAIVKQLSTHPNAWIAEAAQYVLSPHPDHRSDLFQLLRDDTSHAD
ncbi:hypothetical protein DTL21_09255 [Bremerella cremea]|uniref:HEAT repeat domain-containing protein n=1 Tax=Blastopirellula marina TaxID=124 RepID=A0A2S8FV93_9BACT|nr:MULTISPECIES: hypothetical protein [Pirellulaceae]PQO36098.1 hypothetical protein C5Y83_09250 [Blastopirellula marina]RCS48775.1 hypothetical protein DTL21_09255 [Bremerella cremea]